MANIRIKNIYYMLSYAFQTLRQTGFDDIASEEFDCIHDLLAAILIRGVGSQVKRGLHRDYVRNEESLAGVRGRINMAETIRQQTQFHARLVCSYEEFSPDSLYNQVLKSVMLLLLRHGNVKTENKRALRRLLRYFADVAEIAPAAIRWDAMHYHRNNASYRMLLGICRLAVKGLLMTTESGTQRLATWLQDEEMYRLYEKFVLAYYLRHHPDFLPRAAFIGWDTADGERSEYLPAMKSDITLQNGSRRLIIDTKYYSHTMQSSFLYDRPTFISSNLYQIFTYVKNSDRGATGNVAGILLYARTDEVLTPDEDLVIGGNRISLKTLDLGRDWAGVTDQLERLCAWLQQ